MAEKLEVLVSDADLDFWNIPFDFLGVDSCNADENHTFSQDISLKLDIKSEFVPRKRSYIGTALVEIYMDSILTVLLAAGGKYSEIVDLRQRKAVETFIQFMQNMEEVGSHFNCLSRLQSASKVSEVQIQAVLACHLFSPLLTEGDLVVDNKGCKSDSPVNSESSTSKAECPFCKQPLKEDNTNFGVKDLWHGRADMIIQAKNSREVVTVTVDEVEEGEEGCGDEPALKKTLLADNHLFCLAEVKTIFDGNLSKFVDKKPYKQAICQTLLNAFLAVKYNKNLENTLIPSFLVCQSSVFINFYNVNQDVLLVQSMPMKFLEGGVNYAAFFSVWMALNFQVFPSEMNAEFYSTANKSDFKSCLEVRGVLERYKNDIEHNYNNDIEDNYNNDIEDNFSLAKSKPTDEQSRQHIVPTQKKSELIKVFASKMKGGNQLLMC